MTLCGWLLIILAIAFIFGGLIFWLLRGMGHALDCADDIGDRR